MTKSVIDISVPTTKSLTTKPVLMGKSFTINDLEKRDIKVYKEIEASGLTPFATLDEPCYESLVREFYQNMYVRNRTCISKVQGKEITITEELLAELTGCSRDGAVYSSSWKSDIPESELLRAITGRSSCDGKITFKNLLPQARFFHRLVLGCLCPRDGSRDNISDIDLCLISNICLFRPVNFNSFILNHFINQIKAQFSAKLVYGMLLSDGAKDGAKELSDDINDAT